VLCAESVHKLKSKAATKLILVHAESTVLTYISFQQWKGVTKGDHTLHYGSKFDSHLDCTIASTRGHITYFQLEWYLQLHRSKGKQPISNV